MKSKTIRKYLVQGTILVLLNFFLVVTWKEMRQGSFTTEHKTIKDFIVEEILCLIAVVFLHFLDFLLRNEIFFLLTILISAFFSYTLDKFLREAMQKKIRFISSTFLKIKFFVPKYTLITIFLFFLRKIGSYVTNEFLRSQSPAFVYRYKEFLKRHVPLGNDYFLFMCLIIISFAIVFYYLIIGIFYLIKRRKKLNIN